MNAGRNSLGFGCYAIFNGDQWHWSVYDRDDVWQADYSDEDPDVALQAARDDVARLNS